MSAVQRLGPGVRALALTLLVAASAFVVGGLFVHRTTDGVIVAGLIGLGIVMLDRPVVISILAMCATFIVHRCQGMSSDAHAFVS